MDSDDQIDHRRRINEVAGDLVRQIPRTLKCRSCGQVLLKVKKDAQRRHMSLDILTTIPPEFMQDGTVLCLTCHYCAARTLLKLRESK